MEELMLEEGNPQQALKDKGVIDSGCSRHMTGNISYLSDFEEINGRYVAFGGNPKTGKGNQPNSSACIQGNFDAGKVGKESVSTQQYVLLPLSSTGSKDPHNTDANVAFDVKENESEVHVSPCNRDKLKTHNEKAKREAYRKSLVDLVNVANAPVTAVGPNSTNSTNSFNAAGPSDNAVSPNFEIGGKYLFVDPSQYPDALNMLALEDIIYSDDEEDVYVDDIIFGSTNKELCKAFEKLIKDKFQMSLMGELTFFLGLQVKQKDNGIFISQDKYVAEILRNFGLTDVKMIFRYLKGKPHLGLWYPKDSPFNLVAYSNSDYAGASLDRKSTTGGCQFLGCRLISWQCKKQTVVTTSSTKAEYVAAIVDFLNAHTIQCALMVNPTIYVSCIKQFWASVLIKKFNDAVKLQALIDRKKLIITEDTIRRIGKGFSGVDTPLFDAMLVQQHVQDDAEVKEDDENEVPAAPTLPSPTPATTSPLQQKPIPSPQAQSAQPSSPPQQQPS
nr:copia protein [Tanacetum cinerariifolium]